MLTLVPRLKAHYKVAEHAAPYFSDVLKAYKATHADDVGAKAGLAQAVKDVFPELSSFPPKSLEALGAVESTRAFPSSSRSGPSPRQSSVNGHVRKNAPEDTDCGTANTSSIEPSGEAKAPADESAVPERRTIDPPSTSLVYTPVCAVRPPYTSPTPRLTATHSSPLPPSSFWRPTASSVRPVERTQQKQLDPKPSMSGSSQAVRDDCHRSYYDEERDETEERPKTFGDFVHAWECKRPGGFFAKPRPKAKPQPLNTVDVLAWNP